MTEILVNVIPHRLKALYTLIRVIPLLCWGISSSLVGLGFAHSFNSSLSWLDYGLIILLIILIHGVISHAFNDREDWLSGTDPSSPGVLSGGSKVIAQSFYRLEELSRVGIIALMLVLLMATYFLWKFGPSVLILFAIGIWSAIAYTCPPFRFAYYPLIGEWLCAFPAVLACSAGTFYVLTGTIYPVVVIGGAIHALLAMGLLMHHHLSDISSDLLAAPRKLTTVAWVAVTLGLNRAPLVEGVYFLIALIIGVAGALLFHPVFWITIPFTLGCMRAALITHPEDIISITNQEYLLYWLIIGDAVTKAVFLFY